MPTYYCPFDRCGAAIQYTITKPTTCPRCERRFADAFKVAVAQTPPPPAPVVEEDDEPRLTRSALEARRKSLSTTSVKPRTRRERDDTAANVMTPVGSKAHPALPDPEPESDIEDDTYDPREARRLARELAASIDPSTIVVEDQDDGIVRFSQFVEEAKRNGGKAPSTKTKRRR
jgi:hypothetical protein